MGFIQLEDIYSKRVCTGYITSILFNCIYINWFRFSSAFVCWCVRIWCSFTPYRFVRLFCCKLNVMEWERQKKNNQSAFGFMYNESRINKKLNLRRKKKPKIVHERTAKNEGERWLKIKLNKLKKSKLERVRSTIHSLRPSYKIPHVCTSICIPFARSHAHTHTYPIFIPFTWLFRSSSSLSNASSHNIAIILLLELMSACAHAHAILKFSGNTRATVQ